MKVLKHTAKTTLCKEHLDEQYHEEGQCIVCEKDSAWRAVNERKKQLLKRNEEITWKVDKITEAIDMALSLCLEQRITADKTAHVIYEISAVLQGAK